MHVSIVGYAIELYSGDEGSVPIRRNASHLICNTKSSPTNVIPAVQCIRSFPCADYRSSGVDAQ